MNKRLSRLFGILFLAVELAIVPKAIELMLDQHLSDLPAIRIIALAMTFGSIALCILMLCSSMGEHSSYPRHTFLFELTVFMCGLAAMTEFISKALDATGRPALNMLINTVYYLLCINMAYVLMLYEFLVIGAEKKPKLVKLRKNVALLILLDNLATLANIPLGFFFTISENGTYQSAPTFWIAYIVPLIIIIIITVTAAGEMAPGRPRRAFQSFWIFALIASVLQAWQEMLSVQYTGYTLSLVVIYLNIQSELDTICPAASHPENY